MNKQDIITEVSARFNEGESEESSDVLSRLGADATLDTKGYSLRKENVQLRKALNHSRRALADAEDRIRQLKDESIEQEARLTELWNAIETWFKPQLEKAEYEAALHREKLANFEIKQCTSESHHAQ